MGAILSNSLVVDIVEGVLSGCILGLLTYLIRKWYNQPSRLTLYKRALRQLELSKEYKKILRKSLNKRAVKENLKTDVRGPEFEVQILQNEVLLIDSSLGSVVEQLVVKEIELESRYTFYRSSKQFDEKQAYLKREGKPSSQGVEQPDLHLNTSPKPSPTVVPGTFFAPLQDLQGKAKNCIGRKEDLERLETAFDFSRENLRLIIIEGFGGVGKTTLAAQLAMNVSRHYTVLWVNCRNNVVTAELMLHEMGKIAREQYKYPWLDPIVENISLNEEQMGNGLIEFFSFLSKSNGSTAGKEASRPIALFFDDYYLAEDPALDRLIERIVESQVRVKVVLLIRQRLKLSSKLLAGVGTVEAPLKGFSLEDCRAYLKAHEARFPALTNLDEETIQRIWRRAGQGIPNALEIFIAMTTKRSLQNILERLPNYDPYLDETRRRWFDSLFNELSAEERQVASEVSIFRRPTSRDALIGVSRCPNADRVIDALVDRFIIMFAHETDETGEQYSMHAFWSEYARSLLSATDVKELHTRAAIFYRDFNSVSVYMNVMSDLESCYHFVKAEEVEEAEEILTSIAHTLWSWRRFQEFNEILQEIEKSAAQRHKQLNPRLRLEQSIILYDNGEMDAAADILNELLRNNAIDVEIEIRALRQLALVYSETDNIAEAKNLLDKGIQLASKHDQTLLQIELLGHLAKIESDYTKMIEYAEQRLKIYSQKKDSDATTARAWILHSIGDSYREQGHYDEAMEFYRQSQDVWDMLGSSPIQIAWLAYDIGQILFEQGKLQEAQQRFGSALKIFQENQFIQGIGQTKIELGRIDSRLGISRSSIRQVEEAIDLLSRIKNTIGIAYGLRGLGEVYLNLGEPDQALLYLKRSLEIDEQTLRGKKGIAASLQRIALAYEQQGKRFLAAGKMTEAGARFQEAQTAIGRAQAIFIDLHTIANFGGIQDDAKRIEQEIAECKISDNK